MFTPKPRARTAPTTPTLPNLSVTPFPLTPLPPAAVHSPTSPPTSLSPLTPLTPLPTSPPRPPNTRHSTPAPNPFEAEMARFVTGVTEAIGPRAASPHPLLSQPLPSPHAMAGHIRELRRQLVNAEDEVAYAHELVRRTEDDNAYLCRQVTVLTEQREALRDRLEGRHGVEWNGRDRKEDGGRKEWGSIGRMEGKRYKGARYA